MIERFADDEKGGFFETSSDHERLVARRKDLEDHPIPSGNSSAAYGLLRLAALTGEHRVRGARGLGAAAAARARAASTRRRSATCSRRSTSTSRRSRRWRSRATDLAPLERVVRSAFRPHLVLAGGPRRRRAAARGARAGRRPRRGLRLRALRLQAPGDRARRSSNGCSPSQPRAAARGPAPRARTTSRVRLACWGPRPAASAAEARAQRLVRAQLRAGRPARGHAAVRRARAAGALAT